MEISVKISGTRALTARDHSIAPGKTRTNF
jgi:hypothetical protein